MAYLILIRHGESVWNAKGLWTGWTDVNLSEKGKYEARQAAQRIRSFDIDLVYTSALKRAIETWQEIADELKIINIPVVSNKALDERNYGDYTGQNKWDIESKIGEKQFDLIRRGWDIPIPNGESLKQVYERVVPYYQNQILPNLKDGKNILISAHGNSLRSLVKFLDKISDDDVMDLEIATGEVLIYQIDSQGIVISKEIKKADS